MSNEKFETNQDAALIFST